MMAGSDDGTMNLYFTKPKPNRFLWSTIAVTLCCCVVVGLAAVIGMSLSARNTAPAADGGEYVRLVILCLTFWGPILVFTFWYITFPIIIAFGLLTASIRRRGIDNGSDQQVPTNG